MIIAGDVRSRTLGLGMDDGVSCYTTGEYDMQPMAARMSLAGGERAGDSSSRWSMAVYSGGGGWTAASIWPSWYIWAGAALGMSYTFVDIPDPLQDDSIERNR